MRPAADSDARLAHVDAEIRALLRALAKLGDTMVGLMNQRTGLRLELRNPRTERGRADVLEVRLAETERDQDLLGQRMDDVAGQLRDRKHLEDALLRQLAPARRSRPSHPAPPAARQPSLWEATT